MIELFVKRPVMTVMFVAVFMVMGAVSFFNISLEATPKIDMPFATVRVIYPGAAPLEVESQVINKVEEAVAEISGIKKITSRSMENIGFVFIEFNLGNDINIKAVEVKDKVEAIVNDLPKNIEKPIIEKFDPMVKPVMDLILSSETLDGRVLYEFVDKKLKNKLSSIEGVAAADIYGGKIRQINIRLDPSLMKQNYITITDVVKTISLRNMNVPGGTIDKKDNTISVRFLGEFETVEEIRNMVLVSRDKAKLKLSDIANIEDGHKKVESIARFNGKEAVGISIKKISDGNAVDVSKAVRKILPEIQKLIPKGAKLEIASDVSTFIVNDTVSTEWNIVIGILLTVIILLLFTGNVRLTFIASVVIPTSIISSFFPMDSANFTINMMTLLAIATALGTLIANAIVIIESVLVHLAQGKSPQQAAIDGTKETASAVLAAAGTNLVVFTPIAFMGGIVGQFMREFGLTVVFATIFSLIASFSLTPMLCAVLLKPIKAGKKKNLLTRGSDRAVAFLIAEYKVLFDTVFRFPKTTILLSLLTLYSTSYIIKDIGNEFIPEYDQNKMIANITMPTGTTIERTLEVVKKVEQIATKHPEVVSVLSSLGDNGAQNATITINLQKSELRKKSDLDLIKDMTINVVKIPDAEIALVRGEGKGGNDAGDVTINVFGINYDDIVKSSGEIATIMTDSGYFRSISLSYKNPKDEISFIPDQEKLIDYGLSNASLAQTIRASIYGDDSNIYKENGEEYEINISLNKNYRQNINDLKEINVISRKGMLPITMLGKIKMKKSVPPIWHRDKMRIIQVNGFLSKSTAGQVKQVLDAKFNKVNFGIGGSYKYAGNAEMQEESQREIGKAFIIATILTYMVLAAILNSFSSPFVIALSIATSFTGVFFMLFFMEHSINIASMLAMVMLVGLVVNNSILILDYAIRKMEEGHEILEALWLGASAKFRAVLMTSIAIVFGTVPQLDSIMLAKATMGSVVIGGMLASIVFSLLFTPVVFWYFERASRFVRKLF